jgi:glutathione-regulated potassium-efflux system ancillary protein KefG
LPKVLCILAHPHMEKSRVNRALWSKLRELAIADPEGFTLVDLNSEYPYFDIDVPLEQQRLLAHEHIFFLHPIYWYSMPPLLKPWMDEVLEIGFAYGSGGTKLKGKNYHLAVTLGGPEVAYGPEGYNRFTLEQLLTPQEQTAHLCGMKWHKALRLHGSLQASEAAIEEYIHSVTSELLRARGSL